MSLVLGIAVGSALVLSAYSYIVFALNLPLIPRINLLFPFYLCSTSGWFGYTLLIIPPFVVVIGRLWIFMASEVIVAPLRKKKKQKDCVSWGRRTWR